MVPWILCSAWGPPVLLYPASLIVLISRPNLILFLPSSTV